jgi:hypothetical protein
LPQAACSRHEVPAFAGMTEGYMVEKHNSPRYPAVVLAMLLLVYTFNFLDRQILSILAQPVKKDLGLDDAQLGMLGGLAFAALYSTLAIPLALLADRTSRTWVITVSLGMWSGFTALCGFAQNFTQMFLFRLGVGVGEAGGVAPSYALISDYFPPEKRARALSIYSLGIPLGRRGRRAARRLHRAECRVADRVHRRRARRRGDRAGLPAGGPGPAPRRRAPRTRCRSPASSDPRRQAGFWLMAFGAAAGSMCGYGVAFWLPSLMQRSFGLTLVETGQFFGALLLTGGVAGHLARRLARRPARRAQPPLVRAGAGDLLRRGDAACSSRACCRAAGRSPSPCSCCRKLWSMSGSARCSPRSSISCPRICAPPLRRASC